MCHQRIISLPGAWSTSIESNVAFRSFVHVLEDFGHELVVCRLKLIPKICSSTLVVFKRFMTHSTGPSFAYPHSAFLTYWRLKSWKCLTSSVCSVFKYSLYFEIGFVVDAASCNIKWRSEKKFQCHNFDLYKFVRWRSSS